MMHQIIRIRTATQIILGMFNGKFTGTPKNKSGNHKGYSRSLPVRLVYQISVADWISWQPQSPVWFLGEYPSRAAVDKVDKKAKADDIKITPNLQWTCLDDSAKLWREWLKQD